MKGILSVLIFFPILMGLFLLILPRSRRFVLGYTSIVLAMEFLIALLLLNDFSLKTTDFQFVERYPWISKLNIYYHVGLDGISLVLVLMATLISLVAYLISFSHVKTSETLYSVLYLLMVSGLVGVFLALDMFLFFIFYELVLIPSYFILSIWGDENRHYAVFKFVLYTLLGSIFLAVAIAILYINFRTFDFVTLREQVALLSPYLKYILFIFMFLAFAVKSPLFPFHTWLPDTYASSPYPLVVVLSGIMAKMGSYGLLRFNVGLLPDVAVALGSLVVALALVNIIYGGFMASVQTDLKRLLAYSSFAHMGFIVLGIFAFNVEGIQGATIQMLNHAVSSGALFILAGMLYVRFGTTRMDEFGGLARRIPIMMVLFAIFMLSYIGLPGLNGFVGEFFTLLGAYMNAPIYAYVGVLGIIVAVIYMLPAYQRIAFLKPKSDEKVPDIKPLELLPIVPLLFLVFFIGIYPKAVLKLSESTSVGLVQHIKKGVER